MDCVSELRRLSKPVENVDGGRAVYLDQHHPGWRNRIPMRIDDPEALELVLGLLDQEITRALANGRIRDHNQYAAERK